MDLTASTNPGTYYYGACVDAATDESDTTNNCSASVEVTVREPELDPPPDEETLPLIRVTDVVATEGFDPEMVFRVTLDKASAVPVTVRYATADDSAHAGSDYEQARGTLTFAMAETDKAVKVTIIDDAVEDSEETFRLVLSDPTGAVLADAEAVGMILNTEPLDDYRADTNDDGHRLGQRLPNGHARVGRRSGLDKGNARRRYALRDRLRGRGDGAGNAV